MFVRLVRHVMPCLPYLWARAGTDTSDYVITDPQSDLQLTRKPQATAETAGGCLPTPGCQVRCMSDDWSVVTSASLPHTVASSICTQCRAKFTSARRARAALGAWGAGMAVSAALPGCCWGTDCWAPAGAASPDSPGSRISTSSAVAVACMT